MEDDPLRSGARPAGSRSVGLALAVGLAVAISVAGLVYSIIAIPLYLLAQSDSSGLDRPFIRDGFFKVALPAGLLVGTLVGAAVGVWYGRGGHLPTDRTPE